MGVHFRFVYHVLANGRRADLFPAVVAHGCDKPKWLLKPAFTDWEEELRWTWCGWAGQV